jgi:hypothetical protein
MLLTLFGITSDTPLIMRPIRLQLPNGFYGKIVFFSSKKTGPNQKAVDLFGTPGSGKTN